MSIFGNRKCFTFTWTVENASCCWHRRNEYLKSPTFVINALQESKCFLKMKLSEYKEDDYIYLYLHGIDPHLGKIDCEFALLSKEGSVLTSSILKNITDCTAFLWLKQRKEIFIADTSPEDPENKLTVRCKIWKSVYEMTEDVQCFARTRIGIKREAFSWKIQNFDSLQSGEKYIYQIKSMSNNEVLMTFSLFLKNMCIDEDSINIQLVSEKSGIKYIFFHLLPVGVYGEANKGIRKEFFFDEDSNSKSFILPFSKKDLMAKKDLCLPNNVLSLRCECVFSTGTVILNEIESVIHDCESVASTETGNRRSNEEKTISASKRALNDDLESLFCGNILSDIKLKIKDETLLAHKSILSARSAVFKTMFVNNEKFNECVDIEDLDRDTVFRMLQYVYTAEITDLQWEHALELYRAADKYLILPLRDECSAYLKSHLSPTNACNALIFADLHQDENLKTSVQEFIFNHDVMKSEEWKQLMKNRVKLAADTMYLRIQSKTSTSETVIPQFCMKSTRAISSSLFDNTITETTKASSLSNSSNRSTFFESKEFKHSMMEKSSAISFTFGNIEQKSPIKQPFSFGSNSEKQPVTPSFSFGRNRAKESVTPSFSFGSSEKESFVSSVSLGSSSEKKPVAQSFSFGSSEKKPVAQSFSFGRNREKEPVTPPFSFGCSETEPFSPSVSLGISCDKEPVTPSFLFDLSNEKKLFKQTFSLGGELRMTPVNRSISLRRRRRFRRRKQEPLPPISSACISENEPAIPSFSFGGNSEKKESTTLSFSFGDSTEKGAVSTSFSFNNSIKKEPVKPSIFFSSGNEKESVKPSFSVENNEKSPDNPSFSHGSK